jgi:hypothetical protein
MSLYLGENLVSGVATPVDGARNIGQIIQSTIPLTDAGLHLLDGSVIQGGGSYSDFVDYIAGLVSTHPNLFTTEANWQTSVTNFGSCEKYVYDSVNNTVRLPKYTTEHGYLVKSYSNGTDWYRIYSDGWCEQGGQINHYSSNQRITVNFLKTMADTNYSIYRDVISTYTSGTTDYYWHGFYSISETGFECGVAGDANTCYKWKVCGYTNIANYKSIIYEYLVIATSTKTDIEVDIDDVVTDLNNKLDKTDLKPVECIIETYRNGTNWYRIWSDGWIEQGGQTNQTAETITLHKEMADTNYSVSVTCKRGTAPVSGEGDTCGYASSTTQIYTNSGATGYGVYWEVKGYMNTGE